jgi:hypothetical protein
MIVKSVRMGTLPLFTLLGVLIACLPGWLPQAQSQTLAVSRPDGYVSMAALAPDASTIAVNLSRSTQKGDGSWVNSEVLEILNATDMRILSKTEMPSAASITKVPLASAYAYVGYCDEGKYVVAFDKNTELYVIDSTSHALHRVIDLGFGTFTTHQTAYEINQVMVSCSAGSSQLAVAATGGAFGSGVVQMFDLASGKRGAVDQAMPPATILEAISVSASGTELAILLRDARSMFNSLKEANVEVHDTANMSTISRFSTGGTVRAISFAGATEIAILPIEKQGSNGRIGIQIWNISSGKEIRTLNDKHADVQGSVSVAVKTPLVLGYIPDLHKCSLCNGLEGRTEVTAQRISVWNLDSGDQVFKSEKFGPMLPHISPQCVLSQDGRTALLYWPFTDVNVKLIRIS